MSLASFGEASRVVQPGNQDEFCAASSLFIIVHDGAGFGVMENMGMEKVTSTPEWHKPPCSCSLWCYWGTALIETRVDGPWHLDHKAFSYDLLLHIWWELAQSSVHPTARRASIRL